MPRNIAAEEYAMYNNSTTMNKFNESNVNAQMNKGMGNVKEGVGKTLGDKSMESEGQAQHTTGMMQRAEGKVEEMFNDAKDKIEGAFGGFKKSTK
ncbi:hypothetical protein BX666DRAFT_2023945 [Dichotomocladium elegans]|nr:hypothetical protein BX666DRAFT_2023945 [Dichotomocladium elegans]